MTSAVVRRPRPVLCMTEHEHRSRAIADAVVEGRFNVAGQTRTLGTDPDWHGADLPQDAEWRIEWVKFGVGARPRTRRLPARRGRSSTASWIRQCAPGEDAAEVTARRILNWIYAWQRFEPAGEHADAPVRQPRRPGRARPRQPRPRPQPPHARALRAADRRPRVPRARHRSSSPSPRSTATSPPTSTPTASTARPRRTTTRSRCARSSARARTPAATASSSRPASTSAFARAQCLPRPLHPSRRDHSRAVGRRHRRLHARCSATAHLNGTSAFPDGGYHVQRSSWDPDARFLIFDCGPLGDGGHGHYDAAQHRGARARPAARARPRPRQLLRGTARTCAAGSAAPPPTTR